MTLEQAIITLEAREEVNRAMIPKPESDYDTFCLNESEAIDIALDELKHRIKAEHRICERCGKEYRVLDKKQRFCSKECRRLRNDNGKSSFLNQKI